MDQVSGRWRFPTPTVPRPLDWFLWNLKYIIISRTRPRMQNFRGPCQRGWSVQIASLTHQSFCPFFVSSPRPQVTSLDTPLRAIRHYASFSPRKCLLGVRTMKIEIWPSLPTKNVKIWTLSWRSIENCNCPNSGTVSRIQFKLGTALLWRYCLFVILCQYS